MTDSDSNRLELVLEAALLAAGRPLSMAQLETLFQQDSAPPTRDAIRKGLAELATAWEGRSLVLQEVASGYRAQVRDDFEPWVARLWDEKPPRYSRALLETLAIIAYRQPVTRPEIEEVRGVSVSTQIMRTLQEREWVRVVGHRDAPGKPAMFGTTRQFLDHFNLKTLDQLPPLSELRELDSRYPELGFEDAPGSESAGDDGVGGSATTVAADSAHGEADDVVEATEAGNAEEQVKVASADAADAEAVTSEALTESGENQVDAGEVVGNAVTAEEPDGDEKDEDDDEEAGDRAASVDGRGTGRGGLGTS